ncbi:MAG TPA: flagellin [Solirubrobacteraceae bacterium]|jgi:flagellin|nr:flagellin [Solirubrobacteraceae bacterium]
MSLSILTNISAMDTHRNLVASQNAVSTAMQRLSSGLRINTAADDAAGYAISQGLTSQVNGFDQASRNVGDATSMVQTAESSLNNVQSMLQRVRELAVQYQNGDLSSGDKTDIQNEVNQLTQEVDRQRGAVTFNGINLLNGTAGGANGVTFQVGANSGDTLSASFADVEGSTGLGVTGFSWSQAAGGGTVFDLSQANALSTLDTAIGNVSNQAATLGAVQNRLQYTSDAISSTKENLSASNSRIQDVDMASEMTTLTQQQILQQAGTAMLAQANSQPQLVLKLLQ